MDAYWRAANYLSVGQIYFYENPLLREPLRPGYVKPLAASLGRRERAPVASYAPLRGHSNGKGPIGESYPHDRARGPMIVVVYGKPDCSLCEKAIAILEHLQREFGFHIEHVDITKDPGLFLRYRERAPVVVLGSLRAQLVGAGHARQSECTMPSRSMHNSTWPSGGSRATSEVVPV